MKRRILFALALGCIALHTTFDARAAVFYVGADTDAACDFTDVQSALNQAATTPGADVIRLVHARAYTNQALTVHGADDVDVLGGFDSCSDPNGAGPITVLDGSGGFANPIVSVNGSGTARLRDLMLYGNDNGSGLSVICACTVELSNVTIHDNHGAPSVFAGGGSVLRIGANVEITSNEAQSCAGLHVANAVLDMSHAASSVVTDNVAAQDGGGLCLYNAVASIGGVIENNTAGRHGGGIAVFGSSALLLYPTSAASRPIVAFNSAHDRGGGLYVAPLDDGDHPTVTGWDAQFLYNEANHGGAIHLDNEIGGDTSIHLCLRSMRAFPAAGGDCPIGVPDGAVACDAASTGCNRLAGNRAQYPDSDLGGLGAAVMSLGPRTRIHLSHAVVRGNDGWTLLGHDEGLVPATAAQIRIDDTLLAGNAIDNAVLFARFVEQVLVQRTTLAGNDATPFGMNNYGTFHLHDSVIFEPGHTTLERSGSTGVEFIDMVLAGETTSLNPSSSVVQTFDPGFVDPAADNWHLRPESPAVDFSNHTNGIHDLEGHARRVDLPQMPNRFGPMDLGAYERQDFGDEIFENGFEWSQ